jgi:hypothetical protein
VGFIQFGNDKSFWNIFGHLERGFYQRLLKASVDTNEVGWLGT